MKTPTTTTTQEIVKTPTILADQDFVQTPTTPENTEIFKTPTTLGSLEIVHTDSVDHSTADVPLVPIELSNDHRVDVITEDKSSRYIKDDIDKDLLSNRADLANEETVTNSAAVDGKDDKLEDDVKESDKSHNLDTICKATSDIGNTQTIDEGRTDNTTITSNDQQLYSIAQESKNELTFTKVSEELKSSSFTQQMTIINTNHAISGMEDDTFEKHVEETACEQNIVTTIQESINLEETCEKTLLDKQDVKSQDEITINIKMEQNIERSEEKLNVLRDELDNLISEEEKMFTCDDNSISNEVLCPVRNLSKNEAFDTSSFKEEQKVEISNQIIGELHFLGK